MFVRFITEFVNEKSETETGIFNAMRFVRENSLTQEADVERLVALKDWFNKYLNAPDRLSNANNKNPAPISLSWFKDSAKVEINKMYEAKEI